MSELSSNEQLLMNYFIANLLEIKKLLQPIREDAGELLMNDNINEVFLDRCKWVLISDLCIRLKIGVDEVALFIENVNMKGLLK